jgi:hypothetical protein
MKDELASNQWWREFTAAEAPVCGPHDALIRFAFRPRDLPGRLPQVIAALADSELRLEHCSVTPSLGQMTARVFLPEDERAAGFQRTHALLLPLADHLTVLAAPPTWKESIDVWGHEPATIDIMRSVKREFDPMSVLNPGRFAGRI